MELYKATDLEVRVNSRYSLKNLNFSISDKEITIIYSRGEESKKLLETLSYLNKPVSGSLFYGSEDLSTFNRSNLEEWRIKDVQYIALEDQLFDELSVRENIYLPITLNRLEENSEYMERLIEDLDLTDIIDELTVNISSIDYMKVKIARSLSLAPFVLLISDIDKGFNKAETTYLFDLISHINNIYKTTIVISVCDEKMIGLGSKTIIINDGTISNV